MFLSISLRSINEMMILVCFKLTIIEKRNIHFLNRTKPSTFIVNSVWYTQYTSSHVVKASNSGTRKLYGNLYQVWKLVLVHNVVKQRFHDGFLVGYHYCSVTSSSEFQAFFVNSCPRMRRIRVTKYNNGLVQMLNFSR